MNKILNLTSLISGSALLMNPMSNLVSNQKVVHSAVERRFFNIGDSANDNGAFVNILRQGASQVSGIASTLGGPVLRKLKAFSFDEYFQNENTFSFVDDNPALLSALKNFGVKSLKPAWNFHLKAEFKLGLLKINVLNSVVDSAKFYKNQGEVDGTNYAVYGAQIIQNAPKNSTNILDQIVNPLDLENQVNNVVNRNLTAQDFVSINIGTTDFIAKVNNHSVNEINEQWVESLINKYDDALNKLLNTDVKNVMTLGLSDLYNHPIVVNNTTTKQQELIENAVKQFNQKLELIVAQKQKNTNKVFSFFNTTKTQEDSIKSTLENYNIWQTNATTNSLSDIFANPAHLMTKRAITLDTNFKPSVRAMDVKNYLYFDEVHFGPYYNSKMAPLIYNFIKSNHKL